MTADVIALREHLVAEVTLLRAFAVNQQRSAASDAASSMSRTRRNSSPMNMIGWQYDARDSAESARTATDAWLAADARLRALDGLIEAQKAQRDAYVLQSTGTFARGRWYTREEIAALAEAPCEGAICAARECLPCGLRRMGPR